MKAQINQMIQEGIELLEKGVLIDTIEKSYLNNGASKELARKLSNNVLFKKFI